MEYKNFAYSSVVTAPSPATTGTSLIITAADGLLFPATPFNVAVWPAGLLPLSTNAEIMTVTDVTIDTFTIVREQEDTSARTIVIGDRIAATITAFTARTFRYLNPVIKTTTYIVGEDDDLVVCNSISPFTITLLKATGSGRIVNLKNINIGEVTLEADGTETIDAELNQTVNQFDNIQVCDYAVGLWIIL